MAKRKGSFSNYDGPPGHPADPIITESRDFKRMGNVGMGRRGKGRKRDPSPNNVPKLGGPERDRKMARRDDPSRGG